MRRTLSISLLLALCCLPMPAPANESLPDPAEAIALYDRGEYAAARAMIERLDAVGDAGGAMLYRLSFCLLRAGDGDGSRRVLERARVALEAELDGATEIEVPFYLVNTYQNLGRTGELQRVAAATVSRIEAGTLSADSGVERFRVAKLYADLGRPNEAASWYSKALDAFAGQESSFEAYVRWAREYLARQTSPPLASSPASAGASGEAARLDREAVEHARAGRYAEAAEAWRASERQRPADPNRARYCAKLAVTAASLGSLPETDAVSGTRWDAMDKAGLQAVLLREAAIARGARRLAAALDSLPSKTEDGERWEKLDDATWRAELERIGSATGVVPTTEGETGRGRPLKKKQRAAVRDRLEAELLRSRPIFVAAGVWFGIGRHGIRETAFFGGFAPLIFREAEWRLDPR